MKLRVGVVGYGFRIAGIVSENFPGLDPDIQIVGVVDPNEAKVRERLLEHDRDSVTFYKSLDKMVREANLDGLMIGTRCHQHTKLAINAAQYDIPLFLEKPVAINMRQATSLEKAFSSSKCEVLVSFPLRMSPLCEFAKEKIHDGAIGEPQHVHASNCVPYGTVYWEEDYRDYSITQGLFLQKATHDLDYLSYLMDSPIVRVAAMANFGKVFGGNKPSGLVCSKCKKQDTCLESPKNRRRNGSGGILEDHPCVFSVDCGSLETGTNEDCSSVLMEFASGAHGVYSQVFYSRRDAAARGATLSGYMGTISFDWYRDELTHVRHHHPFSDTCKAGGGAAHFGGDMELARNFVEMMQGKAKSRCPIHVGIQSAYTCLAAKESVSKGKFVAVRQAE